MATKSFTKSYSNSFIICIIAIIILLATMLMQACKKENVPIAEASVVSVINASPTMATYNFYLNQSKINTGALAFGGALAYFQLRSGEYSAKLTTESSAESLLSETLKFENNKIYSVFFIGKESNLEYLLVNDDIKAPAADKAFIRFINLSPDAPELNLAFKDSINVVTDKAYKQVGEFIEIPAKVYSFQFKDKGTGAVKGEELKDIDIKNGKIYTIISRGMITPTETDQPFSGQVITNQ